MKKCKKCGASKELEHFNKIGNYYKGTCKKCYNIYNNNKRKTFKGWLSKIYSGQKSSSKIRGHINPQYSKEELRVWILNQKNCGSLFINWWYTKKDKLAPSIDRLDDNKPYIFDNIRLTTWENNEKREHSIKRKKVQKIKPDGTVIEEYESVTDAAIKNNRSTKSIRQAIKTKGKSNGFMFNYKLENLM